MMTSESASFQPSKPRNQSPLDPAKLSNQDLGELFKLADKIGKRRYHRLTQQDFEDYRAFDYWRYVDGNGELGTTEESKRWVWQHSSDTCPICDRRYSKQSGRTIDHKLPRSQYPWLSMEFQNLWVICRDCNKEKGERHWYEYEHYILTRHRDRYAAIQRARPATLLQSLKE